MGRKTESNEQKVKKVYPDAFVESKISTFYDDFICIVWSDKNYTLQLSKIISHSETEAWSNAINYINAAKRKKYYKRKITRPNNEKKVKVTIMLYPSDRAAVIEQYGSVQKFINSIVEQLKTN